MPSSSQSELEGLPPLGTVLDGKYRLERVLGVGGMGAVMQAEHEQLGEQVAIKFLLGSAAEDPERVKRFTREAWAAAKIKSDHVVRVLDVASMEDGVPYLVLEYLEGQDLEEVLVQHRRLPVEVAVDYVLQAAEALAEAHKLGIIHRDLKPGNLHRSYRPDGSTWIKVLDFGISKFTRGGDNMTKTSTLMGSPLYMAPEQLASAKHVDARVDVWALAVILYEMITGELPFQGETLPQICTSVLHGQATPVHKLVPDVPTTLWTVLDHALAKIPDDRYPSLVPFARDLSRFGGESAHKSASYIARVLGDEPLPAPKTWDDLRPSLPEGITGGNQHQTESDTLPGEDRDAPELATVPSGKYAAMKAVGAGTSAPVVADSLYQQRPRMGMWVGIGAGVCLLLVLIAVIGLSGDDDPPIAATTDTAEVTPEPAVAPEPTSEPSAEPTSEIDVGASSSASASATATATAETKPKPKAKPVYHPRPKKPPKPKPPKPPPPKQPPDVDPFKHR